MRKLRMWWATRKALWGWGLTADEARLVMERWNLTKDDFVRRDEL